MKIYTGTGDKGRTSLFSGERVSKAHLRIDAYGDVDELNSILGAVAAALPPEGADLKPVLLQIQSDLMHAGAWLAITPQAPAADDLTPLTEGQIQYLENQIDVLEAELAPLGGFILPGGHLSAAWSHVACTVCRRAERRIVALIEQEDGPSKGQHHHMVQVYLNRLSDLLFALARTCNRVSGQDDVPWEK